jgi:hypothetical protein
MNLLQKHRSWEWELFDPLVGSSILELGNKKKSAGDVTFTYKDVFKSLGFRHVSVDTNGLDGALPKDLRKPLNLGTFDMVSNIGTSEHVSENDWDGQVACWRNIVEAMHVGSVLVAITPRPGSWLRHGTWYPHKEFYTELARLNGMEVERCYDSVDRGDNIAPHLRLVYARLRRISDAPFQMPAVGMHRNKR